MTDPKDPTDPAEPVTPARPPRVAPVPFDQDPGRTLIRLDALGTALFVAVSLVASLTDADAVQVANLAVSGILFLAGSVAFTVGFLRAAGRSRTEDVDIAGVVYLTGSAPRPVRRLLLGLWFVQIGVAAATVFTVAPPFGVMAPVWGIGLITAWGARYGAFPPKPPEDRFGRRSAPQ